MKLGEEGRRGARAGPGWRRRCTALLAIIALGPLTGCFDLVQEFWFEADGTARVTVDVAVPRAILHLAGRDPVLRMREEATALEKSLKEDPAVTSFRFHDEVRKDAHHLRWELEVTDATRLPDLYRKAMRGSQAAAEGPQPELEFKVTRTLGGDMVFLQRLVRPVADGGHEGAGAPDLGRQLAGALLAGKQVRVRVQGPAIGETNGTVSEARDAVEWRLPLADLLADDPPLTELRAVVKTGAPLWLWAALLGIPALLLSLAVGAMKRRRRASA